MFLGHMELVMGVVYVKQRVTCKTKLSLLVDQAKRVELFDTKKRSEQRA